MWKVRVVLTSVGIARQVLNFFRNVCTKDGSVRGSIQGCPGGGNTYDWCRVSDVAISLLVAGGGLSCNIGKGKGEQY